MTKEISRSARYEGVALDSAVNVMRAKLDNLSDAYYLSSDSGQVYEADPCIVATRRSKVIDTIVDAVHEGHPGEWPGVVQPDITLEVIQQRDTGRQLRVAILARSALLDTLMNVVRPGNYWIRERGDERVGVIDKSGSEPTTLYRTEMSQASIIAHAMGVKGLHSLLLANGLVGDAWRVLEGYGVVMAKADIIEQREPSNIPEQQTLAQRLAAMTPTERKQYEHLDT